MEMLKEGSQYELLSAAASPNISVFHVKLTDTALRAIEEFNDCVHKLKDRSKSVHSTIQFRGSQGIIQIPIKQSSECRTFGFSLSAVDNLKDASLECIHQANVNGCKSMSTVGILSRNLRVQATDDVYQTTREKMSIAEEESKKARAQTIEQSGPHIGRKVRKTASSKAPSFVTAANPRSRLNKTDQVKPNSLSEPKRGLHSHLNSKLSVQSRKSGDLQTSSHHTVDSFSLRDRVVHLLALRAYKQPELILRLQRDGCRPDVNSLRNILDEVAQCTRNSFTLHRHLCATDVRLEWPLYTDEDKIALSRKLNRLHELPYTESPALSPCPSVGSRGSPRRQSSQKRISSTTGDAGTMPNSKRARLAHTVNKSPLSVIASAVLPSETTQKLSSNVNHSVDSSSEKATTVDDFLTVYKPVNSASERNQYKRDFTNEYAEYLKLHKNTEQRMLIFNELSKALKQHSDGSTDYQRVKQQIFDEYVKLKKDSRYSEDRRRCDYLHRKLGHIKRLVHDYDKSHKSVDCSL